jgi:Mn2+/Fe2+ NRAMP family transporter
MVAPIVVVMMNLATNRRVMAWFTLSSWLRIIGWLTAGVLALRVVGLIATWVIYCNGRPAKRFRD